MSAKCQKRTLTDEAAVKLRTSTHGLPLTRSRSISCRLSHKRYPTNAAYNDLYLKTLKELEISSSRPEPAASKISADVTEQVFAMPYADEGNDAGDLLI